MRLHAPIQDTLVGTQVPNADLHAVTRPRRERSRHRRHLLIGQCLRSDQRRDRHLRRRGLRRLTSSDPVDPRVSHGRLPTLRADHR